MNISKTFQGNSFRQHKAFDTVRIAEEKSKVIKQAFEFARTTLGSDFNSAQIDLSEDLLTETSPSTYSGSIKATLSISTVGGLKRIPINISVEQSVPVIKNAAGFIEGLKQRIGETKGSIDKALAKKEAEAVSKIQGVQDNLVYEAKVADLMHQGKTLTEARIAARAETPKKVTKTATDFSFGDGHTVHSIVDNIPALIPYNKANLPSNMKVGDVINFNGLKYEIVGSSDALSAGKDEHLSDYSNISI